MANIYKEIYKEIKKYKTIVITRHIGADPDALGSQFALKELILNKFIVSFKKFSFFSKSSTFLCISFCFWICFLYFLLLIYISAVVFTHSRPVRTHAAQGSYTAPFQHQC